MTMLDRPTSTDAAGSPADPGPPRPRRRPSIWVRLGVGLAVFCLLVAGALAFGRDIPLVADLLGRADAAPYNGAEFDPPLAVPALTLRRADTGAPFSTSALRGKTSLFFFGYTHCPDVCPTTLLEVAQIREAMGKKGERFDSYFVTVDPERDTPEILAAYTKRMAPTVVPLTGTTEELAAVRQAFGVLAERRDVPGSAIGYAMDHTAGVYLVDPDGRMKLLFPFGMTPEQIAADLTRVVR